MTDYPADDYRPRTALEDALADASGAARAVRPPGFPATHDMSEAWRRVDAAATLEEAEAALIATFALASGNGQARCARALTIWRKEWRKP